MFFVTLTLDHLTLSYGQPIH